MSVLSSIWSSRNPVSLSLLPLSAVFGVIVWLRRTAFRLGLRGTRRFDVPVIVVGNITVGGSGKTPLVIWLAHYLRQQGLHPGIVSRGYRGTASQWPQQVRPDSDPAVVGDEAVLLASRTRCPMCVGPDRPAAIDALQRFTDVDVVISDDGLQHYAMGRDLEIAVIDGERRLGNGFLLPAGPLRESESRLDRVDMVIVNGQGRDDEYSMEIHRPRVHSLKDEGDVRELPSFAPGPVHAIAGVGNPDRFFGMLKGHGIELLEHAFPDHHRFAPTDLVHEDGYPKLMTEKDAVKCQRLPCRDCWVVRVEAEPDADFVHRLNYFVKEIIDG